MKPTFLCLLSLFAHAFAARAQFARRLDYNNRYPIPNRNSRP